MGKENPFYTEKYGKINASHKIFNFKALKIVKMDVIQGVAPKMPGKKVRRQPTRCAVCERQCAVYHHYNVPSCNGCKHFFRRSITCQRKYLCSRYGDCNIREVKCRACRLARCIRAGMDAQLVQKPIIQRADGEELIVRDGGSNKEDEEQTNSPKIYFQKLGERREDSDDFGEIAPLKQFISVEPDTEAISFLNFLLHVEKCKSRIRNSRYGIPLEILHQKRLEEFLDPASKNLLTQSEYFEEGPPLSVSAAELQDLMDGQNLNLHMPSYFLMGLFLAIEFARSLPIFARLDPEDRENLLRHLPMMVHNFDQNFYDGARSVDTLMLPNGSTPILLLKSVQHKSGAIGETFEKLKKRIFCRLMAIIKEAHLDLEEFVLLRVIFLCSSAIPEFSQTGRQLLQSEAERYSRLLFQHLQRERGPLQGAQRFAQLLHLAGPVAAATQAERELFTFSGLLAHQQGSVLPRMAPFAESCVQGIRYKQNGGTQ